MKTKQKVFRIILLILLPLLVFFSLLGIFYAKPCYEGRWGGTCNIGFPLVWNNYSPSDYELGQYFPATSKIDFLPLGVDIIFWLVPIILWIIIFRLVGKNRN